MKLNVFNRKKTVLEKLTSTYDVKLDASASQLIMDVLAKLYDNPVEAAIREYVSNAYDANVEAGATEPVHLHVPTEDEPYLQVSDTGNGLDYLGICRRNRTQSATVTHNSHSEKRMRVCSLLMKGNS